MHAGITVLILNKLFFKNKLKIICSERVSKESYGNGIKGKSIILLARLFYKNAKKIICNSMELAEEFKKISKNKNVTYIYNPTLKINHKKLSKKINIIEKPFIKKNKPIIISIGRLDDNKNQMMILKALNCIKKKINYNLVLIGEGKNKKKLLDYASKNNILKNLFIYNFKKNPFPYLQKSDLFISTSNYEGLPNVLIEAMALNIPIISTNAPAGPREILLNGRAGFLIKRNDFIDLSKKIELFFQSPKIFKLKKKFYKKSLRRFVPKNSFKKYNQIINNLLYSQY